MIKTAIILAAGCGSRLRPILANHLPKGALTLHTHSIMEDSIQTLLAKGITQIYIGTGHGKEWYDELTTRYPEITCIENTEFNTSGSMHTLSLIIPKITTDCLLLESDLIYEKRAVSCLQEFPEDNIILTTPYQNMGDEVYIKSKNDCLVAMSKEPLQERQHVLAGISRCSYTLLQNMNAFYKQGNTKTMNYEDCLVGCRTQHKITLLNNPDIAIMEIDNSHHVMLAKKLYNTINEHNKLQHHEKKYLLNPGPATTSNRIKYAQIVPDICPREHEFNAVLEEIRMHLNELASSQPKTIDSILFTGSGTSAVESILSSCINDSDKLLIIDQGAYGKRMEIMAAIYHLPYEVYTPDPLQCLSINELEHLIKSNNFTHLAFVHHETSTGLLTNIHQIGVLCKKHGLILCVDAISSFGAIPLNMQTDHIDFLAVSSNKNIQGLPGLSAVIARKKALESIQTHKKRTLSLDLYHHHHYTTTHQQSLFTPAVQCAYSFREALRELKEEGIEKRYDRYKKNWQQLVDCMTTHGFKYVINQKDHGYLITAYIISKQDSFSFDDFHDYLYRRHITIYPGKISRYNTFRIANIGALTPEDCTYICSQINEYFSSENGS